MLTVSQYWETVNNEWRYPDQDRRAAAMAHGIEHGISYNDWLWRRARANKPGIYDFSKPSVTPGSILWESLPDSDGRAQESRLASALLFRDEKQRRLWIEARLLDGMTQAAIARMLGISRGRVGELVRKTARRGRFFRLHLVARTSRPTDMGGPRDVWLTFGPPPDPRLDNMYPSRGD